MDVEDAGEVAGAGEELEVDVGGRKKNKSRRILSDIAGTVKLTRLCRFPGGVDGVASHPSLAKRIRGLGFYGWMSI